MGSFARLQFGQRPEASRKALETIRLSHDHAGFSVIGQIREIVPFRHIAITGLDVDDYGVGTGTFLLSDFPTSYVAEYFAGDFVEVDPLVADFRRGLSVVRDSEAFATREARERGHEVLDLLRRHGIPERTAIAVNNGGRAYGAVSVISDRPLTETECALLQHFAVSLHLEASRPSLHSLNAELKLTRGELYCLEYAARGLTSEEIAVRKNYSLETVKTYLKSATRKLGAQNRTHAVAEALRRRLITLS